MSTIETNGFWIRVARSLKVWRLAILNIFSYPQTPAGGSKVQKVEFFDVFNMSSFRLFYESRGPQTQKKYSDTPNSVSFGRNPEIRQNLR